MRTLSVLYLSRRINSQHFQFAYIKFNELAIVAFIFIFLSSFFILIVQELVPCSLVNSLEQCPNSLQLLHAMCSLFFLASFACRTSFTGKTFLVENATPLCSFNLWIQVVQQCESVRASAWPFGFFKPSWACILCFNTSLILASYNRKQVFMFSFRIDSFF